MGLSHQVWFRAPAPARSRPSHREHVDASSRAAFVVWVPVAVVGAAGLAFAAGWLASGHLTWSDGAGIALLIAAAISAALVWLRPAWFDLGIFTNLAAVTLPCIGAVVACFAYLRNRR